MQLASALDLLQLRLDAGDTLLDDAPVGLELRFARSTQKSEPAALPFEMRPGAHQPALLIGEVGELHLQRSLPRPRPCAENFQDQPGAVEHLRVPGLFEIALLHRGERAIHHDQARLQALDQSGDLLDLAGADEGGRADRGDRNDPGFQNRKIDRAGEPHRFLELGVGGTQGGGGAQALGAPCPAPQLRLDDDRTGAA
jgi:hypothetical protein